MKKNYYLLLLLVVTLGFAQAPVGYYSAATGTGYALKTQLHTIIKTGHIDKLYDGLYITYQTSDVDNVPAYENDGTVLDMYSENPTGPDPYTYYSGSTQRCGSYTNEGDCYNREHIIPQSIFNSESPMVSDAHFITPTDGVVNGLRSNFPHGQVGVANKTTQNGSTLGSAANTGYSAGLTGTVFEPIDEFKGDIARMYLYFATRYEDVITTWGNFYAPFNGTSNQVFTDAYKNILLTWNAQDPVSAREIKRNNAIYARQKNRNPYIDDNSYVTKIWGSPLASTTFDTLSEIAVFPNPTNDHKINIQTDAILDAVDLFNVNGQLMQHIQKPALQNSTYSLENLNSGFYFLKLTSNNQSVVKKVIVN